MKKVDNFLNSMSAEAEYIAAHLAEMTLAEKVDAAAFLGAVAKHCSSIDKAVKDEIKKKLKEKVGSVKGELFVANLNIVPTTKFLQSKLKEDDPDLYKKYSSVEPVTRITFEVR